MSRSRNIRAGVVAFGVGTAALVAAALVTASPAEAPGADRVTEATDAPAKPVPTVPEADSGGRSGGPHTDRSGPRKDPSTAAPTDSTTPAPSQSPTISAPGGKTGGPTAPAAPRPKRTGTPSAPITITYYKDCSGFAQKCIDEGTLTMYANRILAGHDYDGYAWMSSVPVGKRVVVSSGPLAGTYEVYGHMKINRQGGKIPDFGRAQLVLQTCVGSGTGFSLLERV